ncbi:M56 family metallopeptidase [Flavilitoribacter nigricans]|nr:M56 family metallopeptidase [Flavilitoribacter nigricans]
MIHLLIKASLVLIVLLAFYKFFLEKESFFAANRIYLLGCLLLAAVLPFLTLPQLVEHQGLVGTLLEPRPVSRTLSAGETLPATDQVINSPEIETNTTSEVPKNANTASDRPAQTTPAAPTPPFTKTGIDPVNGNRPAQRGVLFWLFLVYCFGAAILTLKLLAQIASTGWKIYRNEDKIADEGYVLVNMPGEIDPCSFFKYIFINPAGYDFETYEQIIAHEQIHVRQWHTLDLLLSEIAVIVLWFNPFVWALRKEVEKNIEYQTDEIMLRNHRAERESYQLNLVKIASYTEPLSITTNYNQSLIKNRILRMNAKRSNGYGYLKYTFVAPLLVGLSLLLNEPARGNDQLPTALSGPTDELATASHQLKIAQFSSDQDTLILQTNKLPGYGLFLGGFGQLYLDTLAADDPRRDLIPADMDDLQIGEELVDIKVWHYNSLVQDQHEYLGEFLEKWYPEKIDTANLPSIDDNRVQAVVGKKDGKQVYIVDQNNNQDFRDDPVRLLEKIKWRAMGPPVPVRYRIYNGETLTPDSSWVYIGTFRDDRPWVSAAQHLRSTFSIDDQTFTVQVYNSGSTARWCFEEPEIAITAQNGVQKDTLTFGDKFELGEYLKFGQRYYQFADIANDGRTITLVGDLDIRDNFGTQVGFIAPDFEAVTSEGETVALRDYRGRYLLLANTDRCQPGTKDFIALSERYGAKIDILGIEYSADDLQHKLDHYKPEGTFIVSKENPSIQEFYRDFHCSVVCYLIDPGGRIIDRFKINEWETSLAKHFR